MHLSVKNNQIMFFLVALLG